jgi:surface protein
MNSWKFGSAVNGMSSLFNDKTKFNQDISAWDVSRVTSMRSMFRNAQEFNIDISRWDTSSVTDMNAMFQSASKFNRPIGTWTTQNVQNMERMFQGASAFNQDIRGWNTAKVVTMGEMFYQAPLFNQDTSNWNVANVIDFTRMFEGASAFNRNLCAWRRYLYSPSQKKCSKMFMSSACPNKKSPLDVRFVKVQIIGRSEYLHMAEVQVYDESGNNIAIGRPTTQSSTYEGNPAWGPGKAVDGNQDTHDHTGLDLGSNFEVMRLSFDEPHIRFLSNLFPALPSPSAPWWQVELPDGVAVQRITIFNRKDGCKERLSRAAVSLLDANGRTIGVYHLPDMTNVPSKNIEIFEFGLNHDVRKVKIQSQRTEVLHMAEVQVYDGSTNKAIGKPTTQSSTYLSSAAYDSSKAVDGNQDTISHTNGELGK